jgi:hypothetical protein
MDAGIPFSVFATDFVIFVHIQGRAFSSLSDTAKDMELLGKDMGDYPRGVRRDIPTGQVPTGCKVDD